jgi:hypothetical protein
MRRSSERRGGSVFRHTLFMIVAVVVWTTDCGGSHPPNSGPVQPSNASPPQPPVVVGPITFQSAPRFTSPEVASHQGYATDGTFHYTIDTAVVYKRRDDSAWTVEIRNGDPFAASADPALNHLGDGDYYDGRLFIPAERWASCASFGSQAVIVFDVRSLQPLSTYKLDQTHEVAGVAVDAAAHHLYIASYCDARHIFRYSLDTLSFETAINLSENIALIQGIAYRDGFLYVASDATKNIYTVEVSSGRVERALQFDIGGGSYEGVDFDGRELRWLVDLGVSRKVYYFVPLAAR